MVMVVKTLSSVCEAPSKSSNLHYIPLGRCLNDLCFSDEELKTPGGEVAARKAGSGPCHQMYG